ncbi:MAG: phenylacetate--CoA ligase family protein, partial [Chloroflexi bacterium]|nr:phenylacetate--CoA ligase family protein [Chloroflexota bacterium]
MTKLYTRFLRGAVLPIGSRLAGYGDVMPYLRELEASQWWSAEQLRELQNRKLRRLIAHVYQHVPFYRRVMDERGLTPDDIQTTDDLVKLPIVDKYILTEHY